MRNSRVNDPALKGGACRCLLGSRPRVWRVDIRPTSNIARSDGVGRASEPTPDTPKGGLVRTIAFINHSAFRTRTRGIARIDQDDRYPPQGRDDVPVRTKHREIRAVRGKISRLDTALDDRAGILDMKTIYEAGKAGHVTSRYRGMQPVLPKIAFGAGNGTDERPETLYFGDPRQGESGIRIYDKRVERMAKGYEDPGPWIRVELVVKDDQARSLAKEIGARGFVPAVTGAIREKLDFKEPGTDSNKRRWASASWWAQALGTAEKLALSAKSVARTITEHMQWLETQVARILAKVNMAHDNAPSILNYLLMRGQEKLKPTDRQQIKDYMAIWQTLSQRARAST